MQLLNFLPSFFFSRVKKLFISYLLLACSQIKLVLSWKLAYISTCTFKDKKKEKDSRIRKLQEELVQGQYEVSQCQDWKVLPSGTQICTSSTWFSPT